MDLQPYMLPLNWRRNILSHSYSRIFLYGIGSDNTASYNEGFNHKERKTNSDGTATPCIKVRKIIFPIVVTVLGSLLLPSAAPLLGMLMLGNLFRELGGRSLKSNCTERVD